ncbi:hypothetical protein R3P38DRAFT_2869868 [Favolaschia claudopus]|uniref:MYND-type domain-containing protein n=1 Tax=Favolaschia claudopus TaxID=2862362 RepID=A0AAW0DBJ8_9AGAR
MPPTPISLRSCNNPDCRDFSKANRESLLKCGRCKTATYCDKDCQRAHWPIHKQFCKVWQTTARDNDGTGVRDIKKKMGEFLWLVRSVPDFTAEIFKVFIGFKREDPTSEAIIEFIFGTLAELDEAIRVLSTLPEIGRHVFHGMPGTPEYTDEGTRITLRKRLAKVKDRRVFENAIKKTMSCTRCEPGTRPNLINLLGLVGSREDMLVICATMRLASTYSTHSYDFLYKDLDWCPEPEKPPMDRLTIEDSSDSSPKQGLLHGTMVDFAVD